MAEMVIIADDLSGAADCGIVCTQAGLDTLVLLGDRADVPEAEVLSIDADTRSRSQAVAVAEMVTLTRRYGGPGRLLFKKLDSTLRGHVGAELAAVLRTRRETGPAFILMAPAFPATGRSAPSVVCSCSTARRSSTPRSGSGRLCCIAPTSPRCSDGPGCTRPISGIGHDPGSCVAARRSRLPPRATMPWFAMQPDEADLQAIATAAMPLGRGTIWAGSAGLARYLPDGCGAQPRGAVRRAMPPATVGRSCSSWAACPASRVSRCPGSSGKPASKWSACRPQCCAPASGTRAGPHRMPRLRAAIGSGRDVVALLGSEAAIACYPKGRRCAMPWPTMVAPHATRIGALVCDRRRDGTRRAAGVWRRRAASWWARSSPARRYRSPKTHAPASLLSPRRGRSASPIP